MNHLSLLSQASEYQYYPSQYDQEQMMALMAGVIIFGLIFMAAFYVLYSFMLGKIFKKADIEGWKAWVPVYNNWILLELGGQKGYWSIVSLLPVVGIIGSVFMYIAMYYIGQGLEKIVFSF